MKLKTINAAASVIIFAGAVLLCGCPESPVSVTTVVADQSDTTAEVEEVLLPDSVAKLGATGYEILLPAGYLLNQGKDSTFILSPEKTDTGCAQQLTIRFGEKGIKVPGIRPVNKVSCSFLGQTTSFAEFGRFDQYCSYRSGGVQLDSLCVTVDCSAPPDARLERLFAIALSLRKSSASGN